MRCLLSCFLDPSIDILEVYPIGTIQQENEHPAAGVQLALELKKQIDHFAQPCTLYT